MFKTIKLLWTRFNVSKELIKIIDELQKENEVLKEQSLVFRNRAQEAENTVQKYYRQYTDDNIQRPNGITG